MQETIEFGPEVFTSPEESLKEWLEAYGIGGFASSTIWGMNTPRGYEYLVSFRLDPIPVFRYAMDGIEIEKMVFMVHGENTTVVQYTLLGNRRCTLEIRPLRAFRDYYSPTIKTTRCGAHLFARFSIDH